MPSVGELFVSLGIKGGDKTLDTLGKTSDGMGKIRDLSFEAKAAIVAAAYALEKLFSASGQHALGLENLAAGLDTSKRVLQEYEYVARQAGSSNEELASTFDALSRMSENIQIDPNATPQGFAYMQGVLEKAGKAFPWEGKYSVNAAGAHPEQWFQASQDYLKIEPDKQLGKKIVSGIIGNSPALFKALSEGKFVPEEFAKGHYLSDKEIGANDQNRQRIENMKDALGTAFEKLEAKFGPALLKQLDEILPKFIQLVTAFSKLIADTPAVVKTLGMIFDGWKEIFDELNLIMKTFMEHPTTGTAKFESGGLAPLPTDEKGQPKTDFDRFKDIITSAGLGNDSLASFLWDFLSKKRFDVAPAGHPAVAPGTPSQGENPVPPHLTSPAPKVQPPPQASTGHQIEVNQTLAFAHTGQDTQRVSYDIKKAVRDSFRFLPSTGEVA